MTNASNLKGNHHPAKGKRFTDEQKQQALELARAKVLPRTAIASIFGTTLNSLRRWEEEADQKEQRHSVEQTNGSLVQHEPRVDTPQQSPHMGAPSRSPYRPHDAGHGLGEHEIAAILELKQQHPSMGPAQIRAQLKRFKGWRVSNKAIARVLRDGGHELVHRGSRPQGPEPTRF